MLHRMIYKLAKEIKKKCAMFTSTLPSNLVCLLVKKKLLSYGKDNYQCMRWRYALYFCKHKTVEMMVIVCWLVELY